MDSRATNQFADLPYQQTVYFVHTVPWSCLKGQLYRPKDIITGNL